MAVPGRHLSKGTSGGGALTGEALRFSSVICPPAGHTAVTLHAAAMATSRRYMDEGANRRGALPMAIKPPTGDDAVALDPAGVISSRRHLGESALGWCALARAIAPPADDGAVTPNTTTVVAARRYLGKSAGRRGA